MTEENNIWNKLNVSMTKKNQSEILPLRNVEIKELRKEITATTKNENLNVEKEHEPIARKKLHFTNKKRGRKSNDKKDNNKFTKTHDKFSDDNLKRKVKTHFHNFIIAFLNMKSKHIIGIRNKFGKMSSQITQNITVEYNQNLFQKKIKDIIIEMSEKYQDRNKNKNCLTEIMNIADRNDEIFTILNTTYKDMYINYYLKSNKKTFEGELEDESYEAHIAKLQKLFGDTYVDNYKRNAESLITFFYSCRKRDRNKKLKLKNNESNHIILPDINNNLNNNITNTNDNNYLQVNSNVIMVSKSTQTDTVQIDDEDTCY